MRSILSAEARLLFLALARERALLAFDFDGTLAPMVADREAARLRPVTRRLLRALALLYPCAVISGRSRSDVARRLEGVQLLAVVGNHGAEAGRGPVDRSRRDQVREWKARLATALASSSGIQLEDKGHGIAVHYRQARSRAQARHAVLRAAAGLEGARIFGGHAVVNLVPADAPHKGQALCEVLKRLGRRPVLYVGDDRTDEDVFTEPCVTAGVRVGRTSHSRASWYLASQAEMDDLLRRLIEARTRLDGVTAVPDDLARAVGL